jgi:hypothetical protein
MFNMIFKLFRVAIILGYAAVAKSQDQWGILGFSAGKPVIYSTRKLHKNDKFRAYKIGSLTNEIDVGIVKATFNLKSPLYSIDGSSKGWEHAISRSSEIPLGTMWLCLPKKWHLKEIGENEAVLVNAYGSKGSIKILMRSEGVEANLTVGGKSETIYYYLGYDIK